MIKDNQEKTISTKDRKLADLYRGGPEHLIGNAAACYRELHPKCKDSTAETNGPGVLRKAQVKQYLSEKAKILSQKTDMNAQNVLEESIRYLRIAFGDEPGVYEEFIKVEQDDGTHITRKESVELRRFNPVAVGKALDVIGKNVNVKAFQDSLEVKHVDLESILNRRIKKIEAQAKHPPKLAASDGDIVDD